VAVCWTSQAKAAGAIITAAATNAANHNPCRMTVPIR